MDFELFRPVLGAALARSDRSRGSRPPYDPRADVQGFGAAGALQPLDDAAEFQIRNRLSFMRFLGLALAVS